jgi:hypothetical protein
MAGPLAARQGEGQRGLNPCSAQAMAAVSRNRAGHLVGAELQLLQRREVHERGRDVAEAATSHLVELPFVPGGGAADGDYSRAIGEYGDWDAAEVNDGDWPERRKMVGDDDADHIDSTPLAITRSRKRWRRVRRTAGASGRS